MNIDDFVRIDFIPGWWLSLGVHLDFKHRHLDIHFLWWVIVIGNTRLSLYCGYCEAEINEDARRCPSCGVHLDSIKLG